MTTADYQGVIFFLTALLALAVAIGLTDVDRKP